MTQNRSIAFIPAAVILAAGLVGGGWLLGDGLTRAKRADRAVTVRDLAERDVTADLATWTISTSAVGSELPLLQAKADDDGDNSGATATASPFQKVRVVTTVDFYLQ